MTIVGRETDKKGVSVDTSTTNERTTTTTVTTTEKKKAHNYFAGANAFGRVAPDLWAIHGAYYDLTPFLDTHPGGSEMLLLGRGRDCTEMFESVHALSKRNVHALLAKYRVPADDPRLQRPGTPPAPAELFSWKEDGFYAVLARRVRAHFEAQVSGGDATAYEHSYKATAGYWVKVVLMAVAWVSLISVAYSTGSLWAGLMAGFAMNMIGFCVMHDGSHYGISKNPMVNRVLHTLWSDWNLWSHYLWLRHHTYGHHSYTGIYRRDPDLVNSQLFFRKHNEIPFKPQHKFQSWSTFILLWALPNQHVGQILLYIRAWLTKHVFGVPLEDISLVDLIVSTLIYVPSLFFHIVLPFMLLPVSNALGVMALYWTGQGIGYAVNIIPNHDTFETHTLASKPAVLRDWGEQQLLGSGNHTTDGGMWSTLVTTLWGGMNYQIEHHLFPAVSHVHYAAISKIVQQTAAEFGLPYTTHSWLSAIFSFAKLMAALSLPSSFRPSDAAPSKQRKQD